MRSGSGERAGEKRADNRDRGPGGGYGTMFFPVDASLRLQLAYEPLTVWLLRTYRDPSRFSQIVCPLRSDSEGVNFSSN